MSRLSGALSFCRDLGRSDPSRSRLAGEAFRGGILICGEVVFDSSLFSPSCVKGFSLVDDGTVDCFVGSSGAAGAVGEGAAGDGAEAVPFSVGAVLVSL